MDREAIRAGFRPRKISILFVGESPPANGAFFYVGSPMTEYTRKVFALVYGLRFDSLPEFLSFFKAKGCYLDDLSYDPVDSLRKPVRRRTVNGCVGAFAKRLQQFEPQHVIAFLKSIEAPVRKAVEVANLSMPVHAVPFPGQGNQRRFVAELSDVLKAIHAPDGEPP